MEIEIRARIKNLKYIEKEIIKLGGSLYKAKKQIDKYFGEINLFKKLGYSFLIRIREEANKFFLTYKGSKTHKDGIWEEYELNIDNKIEAIKMFQSMGFNEVIEVRKNRKEYRLDNFSICLGDIENLGSFIEIEYIGHNTEKEKLINIMEKLGIDKQHIIHKGYVTLLLLQNKSPYSKYICH